MLRQVQGISLFIREFLGLTDVEAIPRNISIYERIWNTI
jgi:hypothetical protein